VVDIGGGTTDIAVISMSALCTRVVRVAGNEMDESVMQYLKRKYNLLVVSARGTDQDGDWLGISLEKPLTWK